MRAMWKTSGFLAFNVSFSLHFIIFETGDDEYWLCGNTVTVADIHLSCFLHRLTFVGQAQRFYLSKRPLVTDYYNRILQRNSFRVACGEANSRFLKTKWRLDFTKWRLLRLTELKCSCANSRRNSKWNLNEMCRLILCSRLSA